MNKTATGKAAIVVTAGDLAPEAIALLQDFNLVFAGKTPAEGPA
ncbi:D-3-phosphoglycerate dehydrogenase [Achromobacter xylosoxidans]|nr:D-3-phosphoglycerate dehydrogenase [Achromobacter xylosoxidans]